MNLKDKLVGILRCRTVKPPAGQEFDEPRMIASGWDNYAKQWESDAFPVVSGFNVKYPGDEWTGEAATESSTTYGLGAEITGHFEQFLSTKLLDPYIPQGAAEGLEIGPGGGRLTALLLQRARILHLAEPSETMLDHLHRRFRAETHLRYYHTDGMALPPLAEASLDFAISFDVFVHFEPRLTYWYLRQIAGLLKPGGAGIIHYSNVLTPIGSRQFQLDLENNLQRRKSFAAFGVMCPQLMDAFLRSLGFKILTIDVGLIPRDAIAVFQKPSASGAGLRKG
jgi:SAM-dependent methyltransferase